MCRSPRAGLCFAILPLFFFLCLPIPIHAEISQAERQSTYQQLETFANVLSILQENYVDEINAKKVMEGAISGMLFSLDPHSSYLTAEDFKELQEETEGSFSGIGIEVTVEEGILVVVSAIEGTPADQAGLKAKDKIIKIDGETTQNLNPMEAIKKLRGAKGSKVLLAIHRQGWKDLREFSLTRDTIPLHSVKGTWIEPGLAYIRITNFQSQTTKDLKALLQQLHQRQPINGLALDLRDNPGGLLDQAVSVADIFLDGGLVVSTRGRVVEQNMSFQAHSNEGKNLFPLVVLVNEGSASAAEIVTGAIQDHKRGLVVGAKTFGKGSVQTILPLPEGAGLRMTTARYYTPSGRSIQATGITPDEIVPLLDSSATAGKNGKNGGNGSNGAITEADLRNHMPNPNPNPNPDQAQEKKQDGAPAPVGESAPDGGNQAGPPDKSGDNPNEPLPVEPAASLSLDPAKDNQLRAAISALKKVVSP